MDKILRPCQTDDKFQPAEKCANVIDDFAFLFCAKKGADVI